MSKIDSRNRSEVGRMAREDGAASPRPLRRPPTIRTRSGLSRRPARAAAGALSRSLAGRSAPGAHGRAAARAPGSAIAAPAAALAFRPAERAIAALPVEAGFTPPAIVRGTGAARLEIGVRRFFP